MARPRSSARRPKSKRGRSSTRSRSWSKKPSRKARRAKNRALARRRVKAARRSQGRRGLRMSARGFKKAKRHGKTKVRSSTFRKLRRAANNPKHDGSPTRGEARATRRGGSASGSSQGASYPPIGKTFMDTNIPKVICTGPWKLYTHRLTQNRTGAKKVMFSASGAGPLTAAIIKKHAVTVEKRADKLGMDRFFEGFTYHGGREFELEFGS